MKIRAYSAAAGSQVPRPRLDSAARPSYIPRLGWHRSSVVEQGNHNPLVAGSNPAGATIFQKILSAPERRPGNAVSAELQAGFRFRRFLRNRTQDHGAE